MRAIAQHPAERGRTGDSAKRGVSSFLRGWIDRLSPGAKQTRRDRLLKRIDRHGRDVAERLARLEVAFSERLEHTDAAVEGLRHRIGELAEGLRTGRAEQDRRFAAEMTGITQALARMRKTRQREAHRLAPDGAIASLAAAVELHLTWIDQPLVLISQVQRSGGTLLSQLFDAHPECHAHPYELLFGERSRPKGEWPEFDLEASPDDWFDVLASGTTARNFEEGYVKPGPARDLGMPHESHPFLLPPWLQRELFTRCVRARRPRDARGIFDAYFTSYFHAWLDHRFREGAKRAVIGFRPILAAQPESVRRFFSDYPDGHLVSILRHPATWWTSARRHKPWLFASLEEAMALWRTSTEALLDNRRSHGARVHLLRFEDLVVETERTMRRLAEELGLRWSETLLEPTFNGAPIKANSSFAVERFGILEEPARRHQGGLDPAELAAIERIVGALYRDAERTVPSAIG
jgi:hypothetical protein